MLSHIILRAVSRWTSSQIGAIGQSSGTRGHKTSPRTVEERVFLPNSIKHFSTTSGGSSSYSKIDKEYQEAIRVLNTFLPNDEQRKQLLMSTTGRSEWILPDNLSYILKSLARSGLTLEELEKLSFIHVAGTKGKGTTVALTETILRSHGVKTGLYTSPHLISVTERIRINGKPITKEKFTCAFWKVFESLEPFMRQDDISGYFQILTIMCFHIFLEEKTDVNVLEVGVGGEVDATNVIRNTKTVGITSLALEHTEVLGDTLEKIAWHKAGIIKPGCNVYTSVTQPECLEVIRQRAEEKKATAVYEVPEFSEYFQDPKFRDALSKISNVSVKINASLAIQLAYDWLRIHKSDIYRNYAPNTIQLTDKVVEGLTSAFWPGRCQLVKFLNFNVHLDGAHTVESICVSVQWFCDSIKNSDNPKVLFFNATKGHDFRPMISVLREKVNFDMVCFVPNLPTGERNPSRHDILPGFGVEDQLTRIHIHKEEWKKLSEELGEVDNAHVFRSILEGFNYVQNCFGEEQQLDVLVTGSIYLVGATIITLHDFEKCLEECKCFLDNFKFVH